MNDLKSDPFPSPRADVGSEGGGACTDGVGGSSGLVPRLSSSRIKHGSHISFTSGSDESPLFSSLSLFFSLNRGGKLK